MRACHIASVVHHDLRRFDQAALGVVPHTRRYQPLLEHQADQFGVDLAENTRWLLGAPFVKVRVALPRY